MKRVRPKTYDKEVTPLSYKIIIGCILMTFYEEMLSYLLRSPNFPRRGDFIHSRCDVTDTKPAKLKGDEWGGGAVDVLRVGMFSSKKTILLSPLHESERAPGCATCLGSAATTTTTTPPSLDPVTSYMLYQYLACVAARSWARLVFGTCGRVERFGLSSQPSKNHPRCVQAPMPACLELHSP
jgi:hypothetical protein